MQLVSGYLPETASMLDPSRVSPQMRQQIIQAYAQQFRVPVAVAVQNINQFQQSYGKLPSLANLQQQDVAGDASRVATRGDVAVGLWDNIIPAAFGDGKLPYASTLAYPVASAMWVPVGWAVRKTKDAYRALGGELDPDSFWGGAGSDALLSYGFRVRGAEPAKRMIANSSLAKRLTGKMAQHAIGRGLGRAGKFIAGGGFGSALDIGSTLTNIGYDFYENASGKKAQRYTQYLRDALGYNADPWKAAALYQGKRGMDSAADTVKLAAQIALHGKTGGLISALGGARIPTEYIPLPGLYDPLLMGKTNKDILWKGLTNWGLEGNVARRKWRYRNRDGKGLGRWLSGEYFNHEHDLVDRQINKERKDFRLMADAYTMAHNPKLAMRIAEAEEGGYGSKLALKQRNSWMRDTKVHNSKKNVYNTAANQVGADVRTLA